MDYIKKVIIRKKSALSSLSWIHLGLILLFPVVVYLIYAYFPVGGHWETYRTATRSLLAFKDPYQAEKFFNPPWALFPVIPFALLPLRIGNAIWAALSIYMFGFVARKLGASWLTTIAFITLPHTLYNLFQVNIDWMVALGIILPPQIGLFLILLKPQLGTFLAVYWAIEAWREGGLSKLARIFGPVSIAFAISFIGYGFYLSKAQFMFRYDGKHFWPYTIPVGLLLFYLSIRDKKPGYAVACAPLLAPYTQPYSWPIAILGFLPDNLWTIVMIVTLWLFKDSGKMWMYEIIHNNPVIGWIIPIW